MPQGETPLPLVSVIVVNYRGADDTITCLRALTQDLDYPKLEILCVDNASGGDDEARLKAVPGVKLITSDENPW